MLGREGERIGRQPRYVRLPVAPGPVLLQRRRRPVLDDGRRRPRAGTQRGDSSTLGFCEYQLREGVVDFPVPFCGARRAGNLFELSQSAEMSLGCRAAKYDRRIAEEARAPGKALGRRRARSSFEKHSLVPPARAAAELSAVSGGAGPEPPAGAARETRRAAGAGPFLPDPPPGPPAGIPGRVWPAASELFFQWANHGLANELETDGDLPGLGETA